MNASLLERTRKGTSHRHHDGHHHHLVILLIITIIILITTLTFFLIMILLIGILTHCSCSYHCVVILVLIGLSLIHI